MNTTSVTTRAHHTHPQTAHEAARKAQAFAAKSHDIMLTIYQDANKPLTEEAAVNIARREVPLSESRLRSAISELYRRGHLTKQTGAGRTRAGNRADTYSAKEAA